VGLSAGWDIMKIQFSSGTRPTRLAKAVRGALAGRGADIPYSRVREGVAHMFGYRSWNDLLANACNGPSTPPDQDVPPVEAAARRGTFTARLSAALGIDPALAAAVVDEVGPTSRKASPFDPAQAILRMARNLTASAVSIAPFEQGGMHGFRLVQRPRQGRGHPALDMLPHMAPTKRALERFALVVSADGAKVGFALGDPKGPEPTSVRDIDPESGNDMLGDMLQEAGLLRARGGDETGEPDALVLGTLARLSPSALSALRACPRISPLAYAIAAGLKPACPFLGLVSELPMLGAEIASLAHSRSCGLDKGDGLREAMIHSDRPMEAYLDVVERFARGKWPARPFSRPGAERAVRAVGRIEVLADLGLLPWHTAFLAFCPAGKLPSNPAELDAAIHFIEMWTDAFQGLIEPEDFFREFDGRWADLRDAAATSAFDLSGAFGEVACVVTRALAGSRGIDVGSMWALEDNHVASIMADRIKRIVTAGKGALGLTAAVAAWRREIDGLVGPDADEDPSPSDAYASLIRSGILPESLASADPEVLAARLHIEPAAYLAALTDDAEATMSEAERRISKPGFPEVTAGPDADHLLGSRVFHEVVIRGLRFQASLNPGGMHLTAYKGGDRLGDIPLDDRGRIGDEPRQGGEGYVACLCKYNDPRIVLEGFREEDLSALQREFGLYSSGQGTTPFAETGAFEGLVTYVVTHPRIAAQVAGGPDDDGLRLRAIYVLARDEASRGGALRLV
jgi:hypothetical protein